MQDGYADVTGVDRDGDLSTIRVYVASMATLLPPKSESRLLQLTDGFPGPKRAKRHGREASHERRTPLPLLRPAESALPLLEGTLREKPP